VVFDQPYFSGHSAGQAADFLSNKEATASEAPPEEGQSRDKRDFDGQMVQISISHDGAYATAMCIAPEEPMPGDVGGEAAARGFESDS
jgi:holo-[acyl-carrier protein] synthase